MILTTGHSIEGYEITEYLDIVAAEFAHQTTYFKGFISKEIYNVSNAAGVLDKTQGGIISGQCRTFIFGPILPLLNASELSEVYSII